MLVEVDVLEHLSVIRVMIWLFYQVQHWYWPSPLQIKTCMNYFIIELVTAAVIEPLTLESWAVCLPYCATAPSKTHCHKLFLLFILVSAAAAVLEPLKLESWFDCSINSETAADQVHCYQNVFELFYRWVSDGSCTWNLDLRIMSCLFTPLCYCQ